MMANQNLSRRKSNEQSDGKSERGTGSTKELLWEIPNSWKWATIKQLGDVVSGGTPSTRVPEYWGNDIVWFTPSDLTGYKSKFIAKGAKSLSSKGLANSSARVISAGSVMFSSRAPVGYVAINNVPAATNQGFKSVVLHHKIFNEYVYHYLKSAKYIAEERATGTTFEELSGSAFGALPIPIPSFNEQHRIVEKIEALFNELDKGVDSLRAAKTDLGLYRQSLLKAAFEGKLTADWRARNPDKLESSDVLLARIRQEREDRYKAALNDWERAVVDWRADGGKGKKPAKPKRPRVDVRSRRKSNEQSDGQGERGTGSATELLWAIPDSWKWAIIKQLGDVVSGGTPSTRVPEYWGNDIVWFTPSDLTGYKSKFIAKGGKSLSSKGLANSSARVIPAGSVMFSSRAPVGYVAINTVPAATNQGFKSVVLHHKIFNEYVYHYLKSAKHIAEERATGTTFEELSGSAFGALPIPIPSLNEQTEIARILDIHFKSAEALETEINASLTRADMLRQSILKKAFSGQLVPQDLNDEPASILLERVEAEKSAKSQESKRKQYRRTVATA